MIYLNDRRKLIEILFLTYFLLIIWIPNSGNGIKIAVLIPIMLISFFYLCKHHFATSLRKSQMLILLMIMSNVGFSIYGFINDGPGAIRILTIDVVWPFIFFMMSLIFPRKENFKSIYFWFLLTGACLSIYDIVYTISNMYGFYNIVQPFYKLIDTGIHYGYNSSTGFFGYNSAHGMFYVFFIPIAITLIYLRLKRLDQNIMKPHFLYITTILIVMGGVLSGKRMYQLTPLICIFLIFLFNLFAEKKKTMYLRGYLFLSICVLTLIVVTILYGDKLFDYITHSMSNLISGFKWNNVDVNSSEYARAMQSNALISGWLEEPIFGHGSGTYAESYTRLDSQLWGYELSYHALLFQKGVIGFIIFWGIALYGIINLYKQTKCRKTRWVFLPILMGFVLFLIANATNPYFGRSSMIWIFYLPLIVSDIRFEQSIDIGLEVNKKCEFNHI